MITLLLLLLIIITLIVSVIFIYQALKKKKSRFKILADISFLMISIFPIIATIFFTIANGKTPSLSFFGESVPVGFFFGIILTALCYDILEAIFCIITIILSIIAIIYERQNIILVITIIQIVLCVLLLFIFIPVGITGTI